MGLLKIANELKVLAINTNTVNQSSFGDISLYDNKATIRYPYVNFDIVTSYVNNNTITYTIRIYVCDRNEPYIAYNKTKLILDSILKHHTLDVTNYTTQFFTLNFKDLVNGCWADFKIEEVVEYNCLASASGFTIQPENNVYQIITELVNLASGTEMVGSSGFNTIDIYDNKATIIYPYVNFDIVNSKIRNNSNNYTFRIHCLDRNVPYVAYNKTELILNNILKHYNLEINDYTINYFTLDYKDLVNGCWADFTITANALFNCLIKDPSGTGNYIITEDLDYIVAEECENKLVAEDTMFFTNTN